MTDRSRSAPTRRLAATLTMTALLAGLTTPVWASTPDSASRSPISKASITKAATAAAATAAPAAGPVTRTDAPTPAPAKQASGGFFKSKAGVLMIGVFAIGTGYAIYSAREDRIRGSNR